MANSIEDKQALGMRWNSYLGILTFFVQMTAVYFLNRWISKDNFGEAIWAYTIVSLALVFSNFGLDFVGIRVKNINSKQLTSTFVFAFIWNFMLFCIFYFGFANLNTKATDFSRSYIQAFSFVFIAQSLMLVPYIRLARSLDFRTISISNFLAKLVGLSFALYFGYTGYIFWSLFFLYLGSLILQNIALSLVARWNLHASPDWNFLKKELTMAMSFLSHKFLDAVPVNIDKILVGERYGQGELAEYHKSIGLINLPSNFFIMPISKVSFTAFSRLSDQKNKLTKLFLENLNLIAFILTPIFFMTFVISRPFTEFYFSTSETPWNLDNISSLIRIFCVAGFVNMFNPIFYSLYSGVVPKKQFNQIVVVQRFFIIISILISFRYGVHILAWTITLAHFVEFLSNAFFSKKYLSKNQITPAIKIFFKTISISFLVSFISWLIKENINLHISNVFMLVFLLCFSVALYFFLSMLWNRTALKLFNRMMLNRTI